MTLRRSSVVKQALSRLLIAVVVLQNFVFAVPMTEAVQRTGAAVRPMVASGERHTLALKSDSTVWAWGSNNVGQLGDGTLAFNHTPIQTLGLTDVTAVAAGRLHSLALKADGTVWAWGYNESGQLGDGGVADPHSTVPVQVSGLTGVTAVAAAGDHSLALKADGTVWAWGANDVGQLGDGDAPNDSNVPVPVFGLTDVTAISAAGTYEGNSHSLALKADGTVWAWGYNGVGQLGDGTGGDFTNDFDSDVPVPVSSLTGATAVAAGSGTSLALKADGTVRVWGCDLGDGTDDCSNVPVQSSISNVTVVSAGGSFSLALKADGTAWAWGENSNGQLGDGTGNPSNVPVQVSGLTGVTAVAASTAFWPHSFAVKADGTMWGWGNDEGGELGDGTSGEDNYKLVPVQANINLYVDPDGVIAISGGGQSAVALKADGTVWNWGYLFGPMYTPAQVHGEDDIGFLTDISAIAGGGSDHFLAVKADGTLWAWGYNDYGQLGDGSNDNTATPVPVSGLTDVIAAAAAGSGNFIGHSLALKSDGTVWAWGSNYYGQLGDGMGGDLTDDFNSNVPVQVLGLTGVTAIAASPSHSLALKSDGTVWAWGDNSGGQLGDNTNDSSNVPVQVVDPGDGSGFLTAITAVSAGGHSLALKADGTVWAWGYNDSGQLGDGTNDGSNVPVQSSINDVTAVSAGGAHSLALKADGTAWSWGYNDNGQLGDGTYDESLTPIAVSDVDLGSSVKAVAATSFIQNSFALKADGTVWSWGNNEAGQLGIGGGGPPVNAPGMVLFPASSPPPPPGPTTSTTDNAVVLSRIAVNATATATVYFTLGSTPLSTPLTLTFDPAFTGLNVDLATAETPDAPDCMSNFQAVDGNTFTADKTDCTGAVIISGVTVVNPPTPGPYLVSWTNDDDGYAMVAIVDDDQVTVMASVDPSITFDLNANLDNSPDAAPYSVALGQLTTSAVSHSDNAGIPSIWANLGTNATGGAQVTVLSANAALRSASAPSDEIPNSAGTMAAGTANYGICVNAATPPSADDGTFQPSSPYDTGTCDPGGDTNDVWALDTVIPTAILDSASAPVTSGVAEIIVSAAISTSTAAHSDYSDTLTFVATGTF